MLDKLISRHLSIIFVVVEWVYVFEKFTCWDVGFKCYFQYGMFKCFGDKLNFLTYLCGLYTLLLFSCLFVQRCHFSVWIGANCHVGMSYYVECLQLLGFFFIFFCFFLVGTVVFYLEVSQKWVFLLRLVAEINRNYNVSSGKISA